MLHHYTQANTNNANKTCALLQTTGGKDDVRIGMICANYYLMGNKQIYVEKASLSPEKRRAH
jgi:hypothetical protein